MPSPAIRFTLKTLILPAMCVALACVGSNALPKKSIATDPCESFYQRLNAKQYDCKGPFSGKTLSQATFEQVVGKHHAWFYKGCPSGDVERATSLCGARLSGLDLSKHWLSYVDLSGADLSSPGPGPKGATKLHQAYLDHADLNSTKLNYSDLTKADLSYANLRNASLYMTRTNGVTLYFADLSGTWLEVDPDSLPDNVSITYATNLQDVKFASSPQSLATLRHELTERGLQKQSRDLTYALRRSELANAGWLEYCFNYVFFELTCEYGRRPNRLLKLLVALLLVCSIAYFLAQKTPGERGGIWAVPDEKRIRIEDGITDAAIPLHDGFPHSSFTNSRLGRIARSFKLHVFGLSLYCSLLSATRIGWGDWNIGTWFIRIQPREYTIRFTGWTRTVSGIQSLISVYLLVLWLLSYFGNPFENWF
jgi:uncharacterized protein YjbI with pentapeptide repeats